LSVAYLDDRPLRAKTVAAPVTSESVLSAEYEFHDPTACRRRMHNFRYVGGASDDTFRRAWNYQVVRPNDGASLIWSWSVDHHGCHHTSSSDRVRSRISRLIDTQQAFRIGSLNGSGSFPRLTRIIYQPANPRKPW